MLGGKVSPAAAPPPLRAASRRAAPAPRAAAKGGGGADKAAGHQVTVTGIVFSPMDEVKPYAGAPEGVALNHPRASFVRAHYADAAEAAVNEQVNVELNIAYVYAAMAAYFDRDNVALPGFARYFRRQAADERGHAQTLIDFQNTRGGRLKLNALLPPQSEYGHEDKGDALYAAELALSLEKLNYEKLMHLHAVLDKHADPQATHFAEYMLEEQAEDLKRAGDLVAQLRRVGKGFGTWQVDHELHEGEFRSRARAGGGGGGGGGGDAV